MMSLWLLERTRCDYDETMGFVIRAETEETARKLAKRRSWEHSQDWLDPQRATCRQIIGPGRTKVILQANLKG